MLHFIKNLEDKTWCKIRKIESAELDITNRSLTVLKLLEEMFGQLKEFIINYRFRDENEEILFFKEIKPRMLCKLLYYRKIYNIEMNRPLCGLEASRNCLKLELNNIQDYISKRLDFYRYYRSGATYMDKVYFLRGTVREADQYLDSFEFERDPLFSTGADFRVAKILAGDMLREYLTRELRALDAHESVPLPDVRLTWLESKTALCEQIFAWHAKGTFGNIPLTRLSSYIQKVFNVELNSNLPRTFNDMSLRNDPTPYLDSLIDALLVKMKRTKKKRSK